MTWKHKADDLPLIARPVWGVVEDYDGHRFVSLVFRICVGCRVHWRFVCDNLEVRGRVTQWASITLPKLPRRRATKEGGR